MNPSASRLRPYVLVIVVSVAGLQLSLPLTPVADASPHTLFLAAVMFSAWYGGRRPGLLATAIGALALDYFFEEPAYTLELSNPSTVVEIIVFVLVSLMISSLSEALRGSRRRAESAEARYRGLFDGSGDAIVVLDEDGRYLDANPATSELLGFGRAE